MIFGVHEYADNPFSGVKGADDYSVQDSFSVLLKDPDAHKVYLLSASPYNPTLPGLVEVNFSSGAKEATYESVFWPTRLDVAVSSEVDLFEGEKEIGGGSIPAFGNITIAIGDGDHDVLADYAFDGRDIVVRMGREDFDFSEFGIVFKGTAKDATWDENVFQIVIRDFGETLAVPIQETLYAGTGTTEGGSDIKGKPKPLCYGSPRLLEPVLLDRTNNVYQVHDGAIKAVDAVYDKLVALTSDGDISADSVLPTVYDWSPVPGRYRTDLSSGLLRLGAPPDGVVTCDIQGDNAGEDGFVQTASDIIKRIVKSKGGLVDADLDLASLADLETQNSSAISVYISSNERPNIADVIDQIIETVGGFWTWTRERLLVVGQLKFGTAQLTLDETNIIHVERVRTGVPFWRRGIGYKKVWRVHSLDEIAAGATAANVELATQEFRFSTSNDSTVQTRRLLARDTDVRALFDTGAAAQTEADRQLDLLKEDRHRYDCRCSRIQFRLRAGLSVLLKISRFGLSGGKRMIVTGISEDTQTGETNLRLWG